MHSAKRLVASVGASVVLLLLAACSSPRDEGGPDPGLRGQWQLQSATDPSGTIPLANQLISLTIDGDNSTAGRSTCSDYTAHVYGNVSTLWVTAAMPTTQNCGTEIQQAIEYRYITDLNQVRTSTLTGGVLHLLAPGIDLQFHRALTIPLTLVVGKTWNLATVAPDSYYATTNPMAAPETGATLRFSPDGVLTGKTACNTFTGHYVQNAGEIVVKNLEKKNTGCSGSSEPTAQTHLLLVLNSGFTFLSGVSDLKISSPRAELSLGFVD